MLKKARFFNMPLTPKQYKQVQRIAGRKDMSMRQWFSEVITTALNQRPEISHSRILEATAGVRLLQEMLQKALRKNGKLELQIRTNGQVKKTEKKNLPFRFRVTTAQHLETFKRSA